MDSDIPQAFEQELTCLICLNYLVDPVTIGCGHSFCRPCLYLSWEEVEAPAKCPTCRAETSQQTHFKTSILLKDMVSYVRRASLCQFLSSEEHLCGTHKETKKIFCEEDKDLLCWPCSKSQEHETHKHSSIEGAAEDYREKLLKKMSSIWEKIQQNQRNQNKESSKIIMWNDYVSLRRMIIKTAYRLPEKMRLNLILSMEISFSNEICNHSSMLFDDLRRLKATGCHQEATVNSQRSNNFASRGTQAFTSGEHYWKLDVDDSCSWALGVCRDPWIRKNGPLIESEEAFLLVCVKEDNHYSFFTTAPVFVSIYRNLWAVLSLFLDFVPRSMSFLNVAKSSLLWSFPPGSFNFPLRPFFFTSGA
ncbi:tripartite motif-containing protein 43-like [Tamandua tetradactyla]|uniref:tripartite motif-containing protein 43-like n=1 Tax=Tamandua tetradactyla TaxID=48850 RepID=UPI00405428D9